MKIIELDDSNAPALSGVDGKIPGQAMDLADATLMAAAEALGLKRGVTLDSDFYGYRLKGKTAYEVVP